MLKTNLTEESKSEGLLASQWLRHLSECLSTTRARIGGRDSDLDSAMEELMRLFQNLRETNGTAWWVGNGGSSALCSHLSQDVLNKLNVRSMNFADTALVTCMANDFGYEEVYARPLRTLAESKDMLIAISSSGNSENILECVRVANEKNMKVVSLSGFHMSNKLWGMRADVSFYLPSSLYGITEVGHEALLHSSIEALWLREKAAKEVETATQH